MKIETKFNVGDVVCSASHARRGIVDHSTISRVRIDFDSDDPDSAIIGYLANGSWLDEPRLISVMDGHAIAMQFHCDKIKELSNGQ